VTAITQHPTREGEVYSAVVLDTCSRRVVVWSSAAAGAAALVTNALGMALTRPARLAHRSRESTALFESLEIFHNRQRRHSSLGMLTPFEFETCQGSTATRTVA
jgi:transposase InsO family protein